MGTLELLARLKIKTTVDSRKAEVILWPGGNPTMWPSNVQEWGELLEKNTQTEFIVGPATFQFSKIDWVGTLAKYANRVSGLFARDPQSYDNLLHASLPLDIHRGLSHDPALYLRDSEFMREHRNAATSEYVLVSMRDDHEANWPKLFLYIKAIRRLLPFLLREYWDMGCGCLQSKYKAQKIVKSLNFDIKVKIRDAAKDSFEVFVETIRRSIEVHTDRLHVMLLAVMLGKPVFAYSTCYGKLESVYKHSLRFLNDANVTFIK
jgi:exopolysaccharide biosynthesis predicted pyruvyltransferase EpsI